MQCMNNEHWTSPPMPSADERSIWSRQQDLLDQRPHQGRFGHCSREGWLHFAFVDKARLCWCLYSSHCRISGQVDMIHESKCSYWFYATFINQWPHRNLFKVFTYYKMGGSGRRGGIYKIPWKCRICRLFLWACTEGDKYSGNSERLTGILLQ